MRRCCSTRRGGGGWAACRGSHFKWHPPRSNPQQGGGAGGRQGTSGAESAGSSEKPVLGTFWSLTRQALQGTLRPPSPRGWPTSAWVGRVRVCAGGELHQPGGRQRGAERDHRGPVPGCAVLLPWLQSEPSVPWVGSIDGGVCRMCWDAILTVKVYSERKYTTQLMARDGGCVLGVCVHCV